MYVLTLIGCVLFSDVGLGDGEEEKRGWGRWGAGRVCARACLCVCGLDEPPEFSLQLWTSLGGKRGKNEREREREGKKVRPRGNQGPKSNWFPPLSQCMCLFWRLLRVLTLCIKRISVDFLGNGKAAAWTAVKLRPENTDWMQCWNNNRYTGFIGCEGDPSTATSCVCFVTLGLTEQPLFPHPQWEELRLHQTQMESFTECDGYEA